MSAERLTLEIGGQADFEPISRMPAFIKPMPKEEGREK